MDRIQSFEFNDSPWCPVTIRESITDVLGETLRLGRIYESLAAAFQEFCDRANSDVILDLCSGSGAAAADMLDAVVGARPGPPKMILCDLLPNVDALRRSQQRHPDLLRIIETSVDATALPPQMDYAAVTIFSALHHFHPEQVQAIIDDCVRTNKSFFFAEPFTRDVRTFVPIFLYAFIPLVLNPFRAHKRKLLKFMITFVIPLIPNAMLWDGLVSVLRIHSGQELLSMADRHRHHYAFEFREIAIPLGGRISVFTGIPRSAAAGPAA